MEKELILAIKRAIFAVLYEKKRLSDGEFRVLSASLWGKTVTQRDEKE